MMAKQISFYGNSPGPLGGMRRESSDPRNQMFRALMQKGVGNVQSPTEGLLKALTQGVGGYFAGQAAGESDDREAAQADSMMKMLSGMQGQTMPTYGDMAPEGEQAQMLAEQDAGLFTEADPYKRGGMEGALAAYDGNKDNLRAVQESYHVR